MLIDEYFENHGYGHDIDDYTGEDNDYKKDIYTAAGSHDVGAAPTILMDIIHVHPAILSMDSILDVVHIGPNRKNNGMSCSSSRIRAPCRRCLLWGS